MSDAIRTTDAAPAEPAVGWLRGVIVDAIDPERLGAFWQAMLGVPVHERDPGWLELEFGPRGSLMAFQPVDPVAHAPGPAPHRHRDRGPRRGHPSGRDPRRRPQGDRALPARRGAPGDDRPRGQRVQPRAPLPARARLTWCRARRSSSATAWRGPPTRVSCSRAPCSAGSPPRATRRSCSATWSTRSPSTSRAPTSTSPRWSRSTPATSRRSSPIRSSAGGWCSASSPSSSSRTPPRSSRARSAGTPARSASTSRW